MALVTSKEMFEKALKSDYAIGAFNVNNMEIIQGIVDAAKAEDAPLILQVSAGARKYARPAYLVKLVEAAMLDTGLDICLHLDHGEDFDICKKCVDDGFTSVMIDGSKYPFEENIALTKRVVEYAHEKGVVVEAELGRLSGIEDNINVDERQATFTDPDEAAEFVERTGVDSLAIAIGTSHGAYKFKGDPYLDFERLEKIHKLLPTTPLVLHGASTVLPEFVDLCNKYGGKIPGARGVPEEMIRTAAKYGICKVNIDTDLRLAMTAEIRRYLVEHPEEFDPRKYLGPARQAIQAMVQHKIRNVLGASGKR
ncbi:MAG: class II fructose-1,6-bisphosphate aldolase [Anaerovoracaceae bacterium]|jgi:fructose-bisphosphate aldolase class II